MRTLNTYNLAPRLIACAMLGSLASSAASAGEAAKTTTPAAAAAAAPSASANKPDAELDDMTFNEKLTTMLQRTEKSIKILREQIVQNQSAPFLADLYLQLGDLLAQKSTVLYYLQMQRDNSTEATTVATSKFSPVVVAQQEAIGIYQQILKEFPTFDKTDKVLYRLAISSKSIDENGAFVVTSERLIKEFPNAKESIQVRLLLGQYFYDQEDYTAALSHLKIVETSSYPYERNAARYRIGLIEINQDKQAAALKHFESVAMDSELKEEENPAQISLKTKTAKTNIKREALIDSVRAYTEVYKVNADPVGYFSRVAPTEPLFQETIEKLAFRYIFLKRYNEAIKLLRTLSERTADPQRIMNIYQEVLAMIPLRDRIDIPVREMEFVLDKYNDWSTHYQASPQLETQAFTFFETQIRELGTHAHDLAKKEPPSPKRDQLLERARQYYHLYLGFFDSSAKSNKIAINLADVYYNKHDYFQSGSYYLRAYNGEFGPVASTKQKADLIQNAILALQKPADYAYYEQLRVKGLQVKAISSYMVLDPSKKKDPALNFALAKAYYEQGYYKRAFTDLFAFMKRFPKAKETEGAADLILNYFNTREDFKNLAAWTNKILALNLDNPHLNSRLKDVSSKAQLKRLDERVKTKKGYDVMSQGASYLAAAMEATDKNLRSAALEQALGRSKAEKDIETFLKTAGTMAKVEKDPQKRADILGSMAEEMLAITRFNQASNILTQITSDPAIPEKAKASAYEKSVKIALLLRDPVKLGQLLRSPSAPGLSQPTKALIASELRSMLDSPIRLPGGLQSFLVASAKDDATLLPLFKASPRLEAPIRTAVYSKIRQLCASAGQASATVCRWGRWPETAKKVAILSEVAGRTPPEMKSIEGVAGELAKVLESLKAYEGSGDPQLDIAVTMANTSAYRSFADFLNRAADANKDVAAVLRAKANESIQASKKNQDQCRSIIQATATSAPTAGLCQDRQVASVSNNLDWPKLRNFTTGAADPRGPGVDDQQKSLFATRTNWKLLYDLSEKYLEMRNFQQASAAASLGRATFAGNEEDFNSLLGCSLVNMGYVNEASFYLKKGSDLNGHKQTCSNQLTGLTR